MSSTKTNIVDAPQSVQVWERLELVVGESGKEGIYSSRVTDISKDHLTISRPDFLRGKSLLANNRTVVVSFTRADAAYSFSATINEQEPKSDREMMLTDLGKIERVQRRRFVRIEVMGKILYAVVPRPLSHRLEQTADDFKTSFSHNISAGGILLPVSSHIRANHILSLDMRHHELSGMQEFVLVVCRHIRRDDKKRNLAGLEFILREDLDQYFTPGEIRLLPEKYTGYDLRVQNGLTQSIFAEQLILRQKGLL